MNTMKVLLENIKQNPPSLGVVFLIFTNIIMLVTILSMAAYYMQTSKDLMEKSFNERNATSKSIANIIYNTTKESITTNNYKTLNEVTAKLIDNRLINFVIIYDTDNKNKVIWSSIPNMKNTNTSLDTIKKMYKEQYPYRKNTKIEKNKIDNKVIVYVAYTLDSNLSYYIQDTANKNPTLAIIFLLLSSIYALILIKLITGPLNSLTNSVNKFAAGDFQHKIPKTYYKELNILINAFNEMAEIIYKTHSSLEEKIKERTIELSEKNEQLNKAMDDLKETQAMLVHGEKMRSLGELVAGITHEINNPVNFIYGNLTHLNNYSKDLTEIIEKYNSYVELLPEDKKQEIEKMLEDKEYEYIKEDLPDLIKSCREGTVRTKNIVMDLKNFSRTDKMVINEIDINKEIDTTLNILYNKFKNKATIHKEFGKIDTIDCYGGQINQVIMNILDNAIFAIGEQGDIYIRTSDDGKNIKVEIEDTGMGIAKENIEKIFEPFFTTKGVGEGTGLGMSISYKIVQAHGGKIDIESALGKGTKFTITLPKDGLQKERN